MDRLQKFNNERKLKEEASNKVADKNRLREYLKKQMTTMMIGCLARFEEKFGELWGHGRSLEEKTDDELDNSAIWKMCRESILDFGNDKINHMHKEISNYNVELTRYKYIFTKDKGNGNS